MRKILIILLLITLLVPIAAGQEDYPHDPPDNGQQPVAEHQWNWTFNTKVLWLGENLEIRVNGPNSTYCQLELRSGNLTIIEALITDLNGTAVFSIPLELSMKTGPYTCMLYSDISVNSVLSTSITLNHDIDNYQSMSLEYILNYMGFEDLNELITHIEDRNTTDLPGRIDEIEDVANYASLETQETRFFLIMIVLVFGAFAMGVAWSHRFDWGEQIADYLSSGESRLGFVGWFTAFLRPDPYSEYGGHQSYSNGQGPKVPDDFEEVPEFKGKSHEQVMKSMETKGRKVGIKPDEDPELQGIGLLQRWKSHKERKEREKYLELKKKHGPKIKKKKKKEVEQ